MAKQVFTVTTDWQEVATGQATITVSSKGSGTLIFNEQQADDTAYKVTANAGEQFQQTEALSTYVKATGPGWEVIADGTL